MFLKGHMIQESTVLGVTYLILILISYMTFRYLGPQDTTVSVTYGVQTGLSAMFFPAIKFHDFTI